GFGLAVNPNTPGNFSTLLASGGGLHEFEAELPRGVVVNPQATPQCTESELHQFAGCPAEDQVGTVAITTSIVRGLDGAPIEHPLFNMVPPPGHPASLGFEVFEGLYVHLLGSVRNDGSFTLTAASKDTLAKVAIAGVRTVLW